jgi:predicted RNA binding protein YcfA (HicA-like mRNA interferase family)
MPPWGPVKRRDLVAGLRKLGFTGPFAGGKHEFMVRGDLVLTIPNLHGADIGVGLLTLVLKQAGVSRKVWESVR